MQPADVRVLIFVVAYNAERTIEAVLARIPPEVFAYDCEILLVDDESADATFERAEAFRRAHPEKRLTVLFNPENQGYGGNQKIGYAYAIRHGFDVAALLHGDGQYAPERLPELLAPVARGEADAVFGTRMAEPGAARRGGMPFYKYLGNRILSGLQNRLLGMGLSEYHSGYRVYSVPALAALPFDCNTDDFHFDTEIIIQFWLKGLRIREVPIPTYYGDEICHVNGLAYAWNVLRATLLVRLHRMEICYQRQYDVGREGVRYPLDRKSVV
jgi:glycosyltransferase involved in cell wall biosynthesis